MTTAISPVAPSAPTLPRPQLKRGQWGGHGPYFSVIICTYNRRDLVLAALASLRHQTLPYELFEVIVVDNGSRDHTFEALRLYAQDDGAPYMSSCQKAAWQIRILREIRNGQAFARNSALRIARGYIAVFLDDDTLADPRFLEHLLLAYEESGADAISGRVELCWEARRPYWLHNSLLDVLGYFAPTTERVVLPPGLNLNSCCFSVKMSALLDVGLPSFTLSKRFNFPTHLAVTELSDRLRQKGYQLWYDPRAAVMHRIYAARLKQPFFIGRAYWQARTEELIRYFKEPQTPPTFNIATLMRAFWQAVREIFSIELIEMSLFSLTRQPTHERLKAYMAQARIWGSFLQRMEILQRAPRGTLQPTVLFIHEDASQVERVVRHLRQHALRCGSSKTMISASWLWRHRTYMGQSIALIHIYNPGALRIAPLQRLRFRLLLFLAHLLGVRVISTDSGGEWQHTHKWRFRAHRHFEQKVFSASDSVLSFTPHNEQLYRDRLLLPRVQYLPHPGLRGLYAQPMKRQEALALLGLPATTEFTFLCLANMHTEREVLRLITAFAEMLKGEHLISSSAGPQLLIVGSPRNRLRSKRVLKLAALNPTVHLFLEASDFQEISAHDLPLCIGATDALVVPHFASTAAGSCELATLFYSYGRVVVAPDLPRFRDVLPSKACLLYNPAEQKALAQTLQRARKRSYTLSEQEKRELAVDTAWERYTGQMLEIYHQLLAGSL